MKYLAAAVWAGFFGWLVSTWVITPILDTIVNAIR